MITDGYAVYVSIIEKLHMTHQKCVFHKIMNQRTPVWKTTNKLERQLKNKENQLEKTKKYNNSKNNPKDKNLEEYRSKTKKDEKTKRN